MKLTFHGAVKTVTGSLHIVETARGDIVLLDCGLFQGRRAEARTRNESLPVPPSKVRAIVLSHAHIDHIGNLPTWVKQGLKCPIFGTAATVDLCSIMLRDSGAIQLHDAEFLNKHRGAGEDWVEPLYLPEHAEATVRLLRGVRYEQWFEVRPGLRCLYRDAGHILGSASVLLEEEANGTKRRLAFTGDVGRPNMPILRDPQPLPAGADVLLSECTYGDREHEPQEELTHKLGEVVQRTFARKGKLLIPSFALGRVQVVMYSLRELQRLGQMPHEEIYVDSPLACEANEIFQRHPECLDDEATSLNDLEGSIFALEGYACLRGAEASKSLNHRADPMVIIAASGMCEAGRILHHLSNGLENPHNTVLIVGFQAEHTLGRRLVEKLPVVKVFGREKKVAAEVVVLNGFSAHAGRSELAGYLDKCRPAGPLFLVHGDESRAKLFKTHLEGLGFPDVRIPDVGQTLTL